MSNTYTGTVDPLNLIPESGQFFPNDWEGTLVEIDLADLPTGASIDNIFYLASPTPGKCFKRVINGKIRAAELGLYTLNNTTAISDKLISAFSHAGITEVIFDYNRPATIIINKSIDGLGKN